MPCPGINSSSFRHLKGILQVERERQMALGLETEACHPEQGEQMASGKADGVSRHVHGWPSCGSLRRACQQASLGRQHSGKGRAERSGVNHGARGPGGRQEGWEGPVSVTSTASAFSLNGEVRRKTGLGGVEEERRVMCSKSQWV